jgi:hypothetical protein
MFLTVTRRTLGDSTFQHVIVKFHLKKKLGVEVLPKTSSLVEISYSRMENIYTCLMAWPEMKHFDKCLII